LDGIAFSVGVGRAILADDRGLGKAIQGIGTAELLAREGGRSQDCSVSEWTIMLDLIERLLVKRGLDYVRLDGSVPQKQRQEREKSAAFATALKERLSQCLERGDDGKLTMTITLPGENALDALARSLAQVLGAQ
jgi:hypothetical protein